MNQLNKINNYPKVKQEVKNFSRDTQQVIHRDEKGLIAIFEEQIDQKRSFVVINTLNQKVKASVETKHLEPLV